MTNKKNQMGELISDLKQIRDELQVRLHLGGQELKDEVGKLDDKLSQLNHRFDPVKTAIGETSGDVWASLELLAGEIKDGFHRIGKSLKTVRK